VFIRSFPDNREYNILSGQLIRSATSNALNYGEAQSGESRKDFIHKLKIILKELRETMICLKILKKINPDPINNKLDKAILECNELISIFVKRVDTSTKKLIAK
jgi:four helix bundle protein